MWYSRTTVFFIESQSGAIIDASWTVHAADNEDTLNLFNYTGSMGFGQTYIQKLLGHCESIDVEDIAESVREPLRKGISEEGRQVVMGGVIAGLSLPIVYSEFGVLSTDSDYDSYTSPPSNSNSLTSPTPTPLTSAPSQTMPLATPPPPLMTPKTYNTLFTASPIAYVDNITAPVLMLIDKDVMRVAPGQGFGFIMRLRGGGRGWDRGWD
ncbi:uncharacterized protein BJ212DRAFT_1485260 [Suillus subaureus]|uniref:Uncharacterized protein n=1 Tax=Suillus subaureus TaxID=48587 RepID=A0A9P7J8H3_9AGAM|nr:uncharacterized protein BJ212DRAFT_1485260 [Suillus subaureus]KAG1807983.1 hypothetical protein BJ212DRAFT_1485260 [Suillus subaureus]